MTTPRHTLMTIVNVTPDSFFGASRSYDRSAIEARIAEALTNGADMIDIGGYSTRPSADEVTVGEELDRVLRGVEVLREAAPTMPFSVDTFRSEVVRGVAERFGTFTVNDISAAAIDPQIVDAAAQYRLPYILMHSAVVSPSMLHPVVDYRGDVTATVHDFLVQKAEEFRSRGIEEIIIDPGFGFSKSIDENFELLRGLHRICALPYRVLVGVSRKSFIYKSLGAQPDDIAPHTAAIHWQALSAGAAILRTHDTRLTREIITLFERYDRG